VEKRSREGFGAPGGRTPMKIHGRIMKIQASE